MAVPGAMLNFVGSAPLRSSAMVAAEMICWPLKLPLARSISPKRPKSRSVAFTPTLVAWPPFAPTPDTGWRRFEVTSRIEPRPPAGAFRVWVPLPAMNEADWQRPMGNPWKGNADFMTLVRDPSGAEMLYAEWAPGSAAPELEVVSRFATRDRATDFSRPSSRARAVSRSANAVSDPAIPSARMMQPSLAD